MKNLILGLFLFGLTTQLFAQVIPLPEVKIEAVNYKYLNTVDTEDTDLSVKMLQEMVAKYDIRDAEIYSDEYETYTVSFFIPDGKILVAYDKDGNILRTIERFKNVKLPMAVSKALVAKFPQWTVSKDIYKVTYNDASGMAKKMYKLKLTNAGETIRVKTDEEGNFL
ncbi:nicotinate-nucleotide adenylyltransferase [Gillisia sp. M10.2A]|uniref:Nicotinate-nucleotide adenylyltransferase n=1 Tax=Gillisia lutea TaxID=2909668 RepID=A0ABS9EE63_9FLAO|nr:nicotinate-nucleotide adenylyltransferase [Gillisia lutea]MCF4101153.1 nicotinate-nucleotide adenylyltransferase [Gillisia lutea]